MVICEPRLARRCIVGDQEVMLAAARCLGVGAVKYCSSELQSDKRFLLDVLDAAEGDDYGLLLRYCGESLLQNKELVMAALCWHIPVPVLAAAGFRQPACVEPAKTPFDRSSHEAAVCMCRPMHTAPNE